MCITDSLKNKSMRYYALIQNKTFQVDGLIMLKPSDLGTLMVWKVSGNLGLNMWAKYTSFMLDSYFGIDMEKSMMKLKKIVEGK